MQTLHAFRRWIDANRVPLIPALVLVAMVIVYLLVGVLSALPPGDGYLYPVYQIYNSFGAFVLQLTSVICLSAGPLLLIGLIWAIRRFLKEDLYTEDQRIFIGLGAIVFMVAIYLVPVFITVTFLPDFTYPGQLDSLTTADRRYYIDVHEGSEASADTFYLSECDSNGLVCERVHTAVEADGWSRAVVLEPDGDSVAVRLSREIIYRHDP